MAISRFEEELLTQPRCLEDMLKAYAGPDSPLKQVDQLAGKRLSSVTFLGMGSSLFASYPAMYMLSLRGLPAHAVDASEYLYYRLDLPREGILPVLISQSGESPEIKKIVEGFGGRQPYIAITNNERSPLAKSAAAVLPIMCDEEQGTTNKTYINTLAVSMLLAAKLAKLDPQEIVAAMRPLPEAMAGMLNGWRGRIGLFADFLADPCHVDLTGRGPSLATVCPGSLILRELAHIKCAAINSGLFRHGLVPSMTRGGAMIAFAPAGVTDHLTIGLARDVVEQGGQVILATNRDIPPGKNQLVYRLPNLGGVFELHMPVLEILLIELLGILFAERRGMTTGAGIIKITPKE